jgi:hypothetical protein
VIESYIVQEEPAAPSWPESASEEELAAAAPDESVTFALEEAVRALFAAPAPAPAEQPAPALAEEPLAAASPMAHPVPEADSRGAAGDEDDEDLIAALQLIPLTVVELITEDGWIGADANESDRLLAGMPIDSVDSDDLDASKAKAAAAGGEREWVALIASLRDDINRLRVERDKPAPRTVVQGVRSERKIKPAQDEWGFFDPAQCGFEALLAKLDEVTDAEDSPVKH